MQSPLFIYLKFNDLFLKWFLIYSNILISNTPPHRGIGVKFLHKGTGW
jgi:hypothetical protein